MKERGKANCRDASVMPPSGARRKTGYNSRSSLIDSSKDLLDANPIQLLVLGPFDQSRPSGHIRDVDVLERVVVKSGVGGGRVEDKSEVVESEMRERARKEMRGRKGDWIRP